MGSVRHRIIRQLVTELFEITCGLAVTVAAMVYLDWYMWPAVSLALAVAGFMSVVSCRRARSILRSPLLTVVELRRRGSFR